MMKFLNDSLRSLAETTSFEALAGVMDERTITVIVSRWERLECLVYNVLAPRGSAFYNFGPQRQLMEIGWNEVDRIYNAFSPQAIENSLLASQHIVPRSTAGFYYTGGLLRQYGDKYAAFPLDAKKFVRRHFSFLAPESLRTRIEDFMETQLRIFASTSTTHASPDENFVFSGIDESSALQCLLGKPVMHWPGDIWNESRAVEFGEWRKSCPGVWNDPCPVLMLDDSPAVSKAIVKFRAEALAILGTFPVLSRWKTRIAESDVYAEDLKADVIAILSGAIKSFTEIEDFSMG